MCSKVYRELNISFQLSVKYITKYNIKLKLRKHIYRIEYNTARNDNYVADFSVICHVAKNMHCFYFPGNLR